MNYFSNAGQDKLVATVLKHRHAGYFLDFGAFDGVNDSNTYYFEKYFGWKGICVEPNPMWYASACAVRSCITANYALWSESRQQLEFVDAHGLSALAAFKDGDSNAEARNKYTQRVLKVDTINPTELLDRFSAPEYIDYLSLDVEGAEETVLKALDLNKYKIALMTVEHNHVDSKQQAVRQLLSKYGYEVAAYYNDDFFFNHKILRSRFGRDYNDPVRAVEQTMSTYKIRVY